MIYVVEGTSNSGKTSLLKNLKKENNENISIIEESNIYIKKYPEFNLDVLPEIENDIKKEDFIQKVLYNVEFKRFEEAREEEKKGKIVFMDRSPLAILGTSFALSNSKNDSSFFELAIKNFKNINNIMNMDSSNLKIIFFYAEPKELKKRNDTFRIDKLTGIWNDLKFLEHQNFYYKNAFKNLKKKNFNVSLIDTTKLKTIDVYNLIKKDLEVQKQQNEKKLFNTKKELELELEL